MKVAHYTLVDIHSLFLVGMKNKAAENSSRFVGRSNEEIIVVNNASHLPLEGKLYFMCIFCSSYITIPMNWITRFMQNMINSRL